MRSYEFSRKNESIFIYVASLPPAKSKSRRELLRYLLLYLLSKRLERLNYILAQALRAFPFVRVLTRLAVRIVDEGLDIELAQDMISGS